MKDTKKLSAVGLITLFVAYSSAFAGSLISPVTASLMEELAGSPVFGINFVISGAALIALVFNFITGFASRYISKKKLQIIGTLCYAVGGLGLVFARGLVPWIIFRSLIGVSSGIVCVTIPAIICEIYIDISRRSRYLGLLNFVGSAVGMMFSLVGGFIAVSSSNWHNVFWLNLIAFAALFGAVFLIPDMGTDTGAGEEKKEDVNDKNKKFNKPYCVALIIGQILCNALFCVIYYLIDLYVVETEIGNSALTGTFSAVGTACAAIASVFFGTIYMRLKRWTAPLAWILVAVPYILLSLVTNAGVFIIMGAVAFAFNSVSYVFYQTKLSELAPQSKVAMLMAISSAAAAAGMYLSPYIPEIVQGIFGVDTMQGSFLYLGLALAVCAAVSVIFIFVLRDTHDKSEKEAEE